MIRFFRSSTTAEAAPGGEREAGFSLLEMLVALAVFLVLAVILVSFAGSISSLWQQGIAHQERRQAALAFTGRLGRDLRHAALPADLAGSTLQFLINPPGLDTNYLLPQAAFWQAPSATERSRGDLAVVGYFVRWVDEGGADAPRLCRFFANASSTNEYRVGEATNAWITQDLLQTGAPATRASGYRGMLGENVLGLWMRALDQNARPITTRADGSAYGPGEFDSRRGYRSSDGRSYANALPASLEVAIVTVDNRTARRLTGSERPATVTTNFWGDVRSFYDGLPDSIRQGAGIHGTVIDLTGAPR